MHDTKSHNGEPTTTMSDRTARWAICHPWSMPSNVPEGAVSHIDDGPKPGGRSRSSARRTSPSKTPRRLDGCPTFGVQYKGGKVLWRTVKTLPPMPLGNVGEHAGARHRRRIGSEKTTPRTVVTAQGAEIKSLAETYPSGVAFATCCSSTANFTDRALHIDPEFSPKEVILSFLSLLRSYQGSKILAP